jgi:hypothetical protein
MFWVTMGSQPMRSRTVDVGRVLERSLVAVVKGPASPFYIGGNVIGVPATILFWIALMDSAFDKQIYIEFLERHIYSATWYKLECRVIGNTG